MSRPYDPKFVGDKAHYTESFGVSRAAFDALLRARDYRLVGCIEEGFNAFYVRNDHWHPWLPRVHPASCLGAQEDDLRKRIHYAARLQTALDKYAWVEPS